VPRALAAEAGSLIREAEASGQKSVDCFIDGVRSVQNQRRDAVSSQHIGSALADSAAYYSVRSEQHFREACVAAARVGGPAAKSAGDNGAVLNLQDQKGGAAGQVAANGDAIGSRDGDSGGSHETLR